jgi:hypothetical protein
MSARGKGGILETRRLTAAPVWRTHGVWSWRSDPVRPWRRLAGGLALPWWPPPGSSSPWIEAILGQETGSFTARALHLRVNGEIG